MNDLLFQLLIQQPESNVLDFKETSYQFHVAKETEDAKFIKDILSFSNTVRKGNAYIIAGVRESVSAIELVGVDDFLDDASLQQKAMDKIWPKPLFLSYKFNYENKVFGIIEFPPHAYSRPLVAVKPMKGVDVDTVYLRRGTSNSIASASEILTIVDWLQSLKLTHTDKSALQDDVNVLLSKVMDRNSQLSSAVSGCLALANKLGMADFEKLCLFELKGYKGRNGESPESFPFRIIQVPVTPYEVSFPPYQNMTPDRMVTHLMERDEFRTIKFFYHYSILDLEQLITNSQEPPAMVTLKIPTQQVFPGIESNIPKSTMFIGPRMLRDLYTAIRNEFVSRLINIQINNYSRGLKI